MSNRTLIEFNHDYTYDIEKHQEQFIRGLIDYLRSGDKSVLPSGFGLTWKNIRHHADDCPVEEFKLMRERNNNEPESF